MRTKRNTRIPFKLLPCGKDYLWGGTRLNDDYDFGMDISPLAEAWVCSSHPDGESCLETGETLAEVIESAPWILGNHVLSLTGGRSALPVLIKLIDANRDLSIQVHPDDEYAALHETDSGKTEMWYVVDARPESELVYGFNRDVSKAIVREYLDNGRIEKLLNHVPVKKDDVFFIESGTVHAIGSGCLIAEVQQNSNLTYRLYDYDRTDRNGKKRELHIGKALDVACFKSSQSPRQPMHVLNYTGGCARELLCRCKHFQVERMILNTEAHRQLVRYKTQKNSFHVLLALDGCGCVLLDTDEEAIVFFKGDCLFVPADSELLKLHGKAQLLDVSC